MITSRRVAGLVIASLVAVQRPAPASAQTPAARAAAQAADSFPHARHGSVFTACESCHAGIGGADTTGYLPSPDLCATCHDGSLVRRVNWTPHRRATNLRFTHAAHPELPCAMCHSATDTAAFMEVGRALPQRCLICHAPDAPSHLAQATCRPCHGALGDARGVLAAGIARFPQPPSHDSTWVFRHRADASGEPGATCATCHAREFCAACHVNAASVEPIRNLPTDERVAALVRGRRVTYRAPATHQSSGFTRTHGALAGTTAAGCANCHARESCLTCHREQERVRPVALLPRRSRGGARGVDLTGLRPRDHAPDFALRHRTAAAVGDAVCSRCHASSFCASCHAGASSPGFHGANFVERHSESAYVRDNDCAACHQTEAFCAACHRTTGQSRASTSRGRYHDAQAAWVFGHGGVARRAIETCAGCHAQSFCLQCHSASRGWRVSPHGPGFDPGQANTSPGMCRYCHESGPPRR